MHCDKYAWSIIVVHSNMHSDNIRNITCYMIAMHVIGWCTFTHDDINMEYTYAQW